MHYLDPLKPTLYWVTVELFYLYWNLLQLYVVLVLTLRSSRYCQGSEEKTPEDSLVVGSDTSQTHVASNFLLGTFIKMGGGIIGLAGELGNKKIQ